MKINNGMNIIGRIELPYFIIPIRAYVHGCGSEVYGVTQQQAVEGARDYLFQILRDSLPDIIDDEGDFIYAVIWGDNGDKVVDIFTFPYERDDNKNLIWPGNPEIDVVVYRNRELTMDSGTCEDSIIVLGEESKFRRSIVNANNIRTF